MSVAENPGCKCTKHQHHEPGDERFGFSAEISERVRSCKTCQAGKRVDRSHGDSCLGIAQNTGRNAVATQMTRNSKTNITFELGKLMRHSNPVAAIKSGAAACQRWCVKEKNEGKQPDGNLAPRVFCR